MRSRLIRRGLVLTSITALCWVSGGYVARAQDEPGTTSSTDEPIVHLKEFQRKMDFMAKRLKDVQADPDATGDAKAGGVTLQQHADDVASARNEFEMCLAGMKAKVADKEASGSGTDAEKAQLTGCIEHCEKVLAKLNALHVGATVLGSADHKTKWLLGDLEAHRKAVQEAQDLSAKCPDMIRGALKSTETKGAKAANFVSADEPVVHLKEFQRRLDWMAERLKKVAVEPDAAAAKDGSITLAQHKADVAAVRAEFTKCLAAMKKKIADKEEAGTATDADKAKFKECTAHCESILAKVNNMHVQATVIGSADHKAKWLVGALDAHKKTVKEVQDLAAKCPEMMDGAMACCQMKH